MFFLNKAWELLSPIDYYFTPICGSFANFVVILMCIADIYFAWCLAQCRRRIDKLEKQ